MSARDPQATTGSTAGYAQLPDCVCGHWGAVHEARNGRRLRCLTADPNRCPCKTYEPAAVAGTTPRREQQ